MTGDLKTPRYLAVDPGTHCGYAVSDSKSVFAGVWDLSPRRHEGGGMRYLKLKRYLREIGPVTMLAYEEVRGHKGTDAAHIYGGVVATLTEWCEENNVPYEGIPVGTIKKHATGKGNSDKTAMIAACVSKLLVTPTDDNEADARWLLDYVVKRETLAL